MSEIVHKITIEHFNEQPYFPPLCGQAGNTRHVDKHQTQSIEEVGITCKKCIAILAKRAGIGDKTL